MYSIKQAHIHSGLPILVVVIIWFMVMFLIGTFTWPYILNHALVLVGKPATVQWWQGGVIGCIPGLDRAGIIIALATWVS